MTSSCGTQVTCQRRVRRPGVPMAERVRPGQRVRLTASFVEVNRSASALGIEIKRGRRPDHPDRRRRCRGPRRRPRPGTACPRHLRRLPHRAPTHLSTGLAVRSAKLRRAGRPGQWSRAVTGARKRDAQSRPRRGLRAVRGAPRVVQRAVDHRMDMVAPRGQMPFHPDPDGMTAGITGMIAHHLTRDR